MEGEYEIHRIYEDNIFVKHSSCTQPPQIYNINFKNVNTDSLNSLIEPSNYTVNVIEKAIFKDYSDVESEISKAIPHF